jgi:hypothetical protein
MSVLADVPPHVSALQRLRESLVSLATQFTAPLFETRLAEPMMPAEERRRRRDLRRLAGALDGLSERQLEVLGLSRGLMLSELEDRYDEMLDRRRALEALFDGDSPETAPARLEAPR